jgi:two-component system, sensor histidine kinase LadS
MTHNLKNKTVILLSLAILVLWFPVLAKSGEPSASGPLILTDNQIEYPLGLHMEILEDPGGELTIDQVSSPAYDAQFIPSKRESPNYGYTDNAYWVRFSLDNET